MKNILARTALLLAALAAATPARAQFKIIVNGRDITADTADSDKSAEKTTARLVLPEGPLKPGTPFYAELVIKSTARFTFGGPITPDIRWENGAAFQNNGASSSMTVTNGAISSTLRVSFSTDAPSKPGTYKIPATRFTLGTTLIEVPEHSVTVRELAPGEAPYEKIGCTIEGPAGTVFPGQPFTMKLVATETEDERILNILDFRLPPDAELTLTPLVEKASAREVTVNGKTRRRIEIPLLGRTLLATDRTSSADILFNIAFDDGSSARRQVTAPLRLRSAHPPETGKPASYQGAIGHFTVSPPELSSKTARTGEPLRLTFGVTGNGSLDRVVPPELASPDWSVRKENPAYRRNADGTATKHFAYTLTPLYGGALATPGAEFSWFDPEDMKYHTAAIPAQPVTVEGPARPAVKQVEAKKIPVLAADPAPTGIIRTHGALFDSRVFLAAQLAALVTLAAAIGIVARRRRIAADPVLVKRIQNLRLLRRRRRAARRAIASGAPGDYAASACRALRAAAALSTAAEPDALTGAETLAALPVDDATRAALAPLFAHEESRLYAGASDTPDSIKNTSAALLSTLAKAATAKR